MALSWLASANDPQSDFRLANLPWGVFHAGDASHIGVAIGDSILDLHACAHASLLSGLAPELLDACRADCLNPLMALGPQAWHALRAAITGLLSDEAPTQARARIEPLLVPMANAEMQLPARIGDYTDFYASIHHATRVGRRFRPDQPLLPNYKYVPIGYHGRASSIVVSGTAIRRPRGQLKQHDAPPIYALTRALDYELEAGIFIGPGNSLGSPIPIAEAEQHIFGLCLLNDWSARDVQSWEYQPLGPFLAKNFATTLSPWIVPLAALEPYRVPAPPRPQGDPAPLPYLDAPATAFDITVEVQIQSRQMREAGMAPIPISRGSLRDLYWTIAQLVAHHASNGCNLRPGDLLGTGTLSGPHQGSEGCLLEKQREGGALQLPSGETRTFLDDGDTVTFRAWAEKAGLPRIGFGACTGTVIANNPQAVR
jgi:fumarylacetoacetase